MDSGNRFYISDINGFNLDKIMSKALELLPEGCPPEINYMFFDPKEGQKEDIVAYVAGESICGVNIVRLTSRKGPKIIVDLPWLASGVDVYLMYAFLNTVKALHPDCRITYCNPEGDYSDEIADLSDEACNGDYAQRIEMIIMLLKTEEKKLNLATINGQWELRPEKYIKDMTEENEIDVALKVVYDIVDDLWYKDEGIEE